jgi:hypothetical protein
MLSGEYSPVFEQVCVLATHPAAGAGAPRCTGPTRCWCSAQLPNTHFTAANVVHERVGARLLNARNSLFWAQMLLSRNFGNDNERALTLLERACAVGRELGSAAIVRDRHSSQITIS